MLKRGCKAITMQVDTSSYAIPKPDAVQKWVKMTTSVYPGVSMWPTHDTNTTDWLSALFLLVAARTHTKRNRLAHCRPNTNTNDCPLALLRTA